MKGEDNTIFLTAAFLLATQYVPKSQIATQSSHIVLGYQ